ncbi:MAG: hypothetical protein ACOX6W_00495 [Lentisphaeria bacterium]
MKEILSPEILVNIGRCDTNNQFFAFLKEHDPRSKTPMIYIFGIPENSILIRADHQSTKPAFLLKDDGMRQRCDYILLTKVNDKDTVICIEMKSKSFGKLEVEKQLKGGDCLLEFLSAVAKKFKGTILDFDPKRIARRYVLICVPDKPTKFKFNNKKPLPCPREKHCSPEDYFKYPAMYTGNSLHIKSTDLIKV